MIGIIINNIEYKFKSLNEARYVASLTGNGFACYIDNHINAARELLSYFKS